MSEEDHREEEVEKLQQFWRERISHWYPHLLHAAHFLPAVFMNRTRYRTETQAGQTVYVPQVPLSNLPRGDRSSFREDEAREDQALQCVLACLRDIAGTRAVQEPAVVDTLESHQMQTPKTSVGKSNSESLKKCKKKASSHHEEKQESSSLSKAAEAETISEAMSTENEDTDKPEAATISEAMSTENEDTDKRISCVKSACSRGATEDDRSQAPRQDSKDQRDQKAQACHQDKLSSTNTDSDGQRSKTRHTEPCTVQKEVMFVISQLQYVNYLRELPGHLNGLLPTPKDMQKENCHRGDFDLLVILRYHGLLVCEVKAVGDKLTNMAENERNESISKKITRALRQLNKAKKVVTHLLSKHKPPPTVNQCLMLPNLTRDVLRRVLQVSPQLKQDLCDCLGTGSDVDVSDLVLTSDTLHHPHQWWQLLMEVTGPDDVMSDQLYLDLVSRFGGPGTSVNMFCPAVPRLGLDAGGDSDGGSGGGGGGDCGGDGGLCRSLGEAVAETSWRFTRLVLHPRQLMVLREDPPLLFITGPPGTGKTTMLVLKALDWLRRGHDVHVLSSWAESQAVSAFIVAQLKHTEPSAQARVHLHDTDLWPRDTRSRTESPVEMALRSLRQCARDGTLLVVTDEVGPDSSDPKRRFSLLCSRLVHDSPSLHTVRIWAASMYHRDRPDILEEFTMTEPLRTPDTITQEVAKYDTLGGRRLQSLVLGYTPCSSPLPCRGVPPREVLHRDEDHGEVTVVADCEQCGREVARVLREELHVGAAGTDCTGSSQGPTPARQIRFKDVALLIRLGDLTKTEEDSEGNSHHVDCGLVRGLQAGGVPVRVLSQYHDDVVTMAGPDAMLVTWNNVLVGLERTVVVWSRYDEWGEAWGRLLAMSRCTGQLIIVKKTE